MSKIKWYGPRRGAGSVEDIVSHKPQVKRELKARANSMASTATNVLAVHRDTGDAHIDTVHAGQTDLDSYVILRASGGKEAPLSIENGSAHFDEQGNEYFQAGIGPLKTAVSLEKRLGLSRR